MKWQLYTLTCFYVLSFYDWLDRIFDLEVSGQYAHNIIRNRRCFIIQETVLIKMGLWYSYCILNKHNIAFAYRTLQTRLKKIKQIILILTNFLCVVNQASTQPV
jgi:hypothetical protein